MANKYKTTALHLWALLAFELVLLQQFGSQITHAEKVLLERSDYELESHPAVLGGKQCVLTIRPLNKNASSYSLPVGASSSYTTNYASR